MKERFIIISEESGSAFGSIYESDTEEIADLFDFVSGGSGTPTEESLTPPSLDDLIEAVQQSTLKDELSIVYDSAHPSDLFFSLDGNWNRQDFPFEITFNEDADLSELEAAVNKEGVVELVGKYTPLH